MMPSEHTRIPSPGLLVLIAFLGALLPACTSDQPGKQYELRTDMYTQPSFRHNEEPRPAPAGTLTVGGSEAAIADSANASRMKNPFAFVAESADTAKALFETYCFPCHGLAAKGDGPVASKFQAPPDLTAPKYQRVPDGYIYWVARNGVRIMPPQSENTSARERWLIISHLRSLQKQ
jgi:mono/diheme cytochrome c family protein